MFAVYSCFYLCLEIYCDAAILFDWKRNVFIILKIYRIGVVLLQNSKPEFILDIYILIEVI